MAPQADGNGTKPPASLWEFVFRWASSQTFNNVLLAAILVFLGYGAHWAMTVGVPAHLSQIQAGYEKLGSEHTRQIQVITSEFRSEVERREDLIREILGKGARKDER